MDTLIAIAGLVLGFGIPAAMTWMVTAGSIRFMSDAKLNNAHNRAEEALNNRIRFVLDHHGSRYSPDSHDRSLLVERDKYRAEIDRREARRG